MEPGTHMDDFVLLTISSSFFAFNFVFNNYFPIKILIMLLLYFFQNKYFGAD